MQKYCNDERHLEHGCYLCIDFLQTELCRLLEERVRGGFSTVHGLYLDGYVESRVARGDQRTYGYPPSALPELHVKSMLTESSIITALRK